MSTHQSRTIAVTIERPLRLVYAFLAEPTNYPRWASVQPGGRFEQVGELEWRAEMSFGTRIIGFSPRNPNGILDHSERAEDGEAMVNPMRVVENGSGTELMLTFYRRPDMSEEAFASAIEWITADLLALKSMLE